MTIRFVAAARGDNRAVARTLGACIPLHATNDNDCRMSHEALVKATLRHFSFHGLSAARRACENAEQAFLAGDRDACRFWLSVCRMLDRRLAATVSAKVEAAG